MDIKITKEQLPVIQINFDEIKPTFQPQWRSIKTL